jgi:CNT family concentrative nucleoside transporter
MDISGAEAVAAASSPWIGQGESACLVRPYIDLMTESELHLMMTSGELFAPYLMHSANTAQTGFSTIAGSTLAAYIGLGVPRENLVASSIMSIPASIAISKMRVPEQDEPLTRGIVVIDRGEEVEKNKPANALHAFSQGAVIGLRVAGQILYDHLV